MRTAGHYQGHKEAGMRIGERDTQEEEEGVRPAAKGIKLHWQFDQLLANIQQVRQHFCPTPPQQQPANNISVCKSSASVVWQHPRNSPPHRNNIIIKKVKIVFFQLDSIADKRTRFEPLKQNGHAV